MSQLTAMESKYSLQHTAIAQNIAENFLRKNITVNDYVTLQTFAKLLHWFGPLKGRKKDEKEKEKENEVTVDEE